jgi:hypothetical protein
MDVPREKLRFTRSRAGAGGKGWLVVNIRGLDLDGVNELAIPMDAVEAISAAGDPVSDALSEAKKLLGG